MSFRPTTTITAYPRTLYATIPLLDAQTPTLNTNPPQFPPDNQNSPAQIAIIKNNTISPTTPKIIQIDSDFSPSSTISPHSGHTDA